MDKYLVSALVSTYNAEKYMADCLEDLENQSISDKLEIIVVNSGSPQNEEAVVKDFQKKYDNIKYIRTEQRETIYAAWNRAVRIASGKYVTNANTDDRHRKDALEIMARALDDNPDKALVYANQSIVRPHKGRNVPVGEGIYGYYLRQRLLSRELDVGSQPLWRRSLHDEFGYFDETFFVAGDTEFWLRVSQKYDFLYLNKILGERLFRPDGVWLSEKDGICEIEKTILFNCFHYALEKPMIIDHRGISGNPVFSQWYEVNLWKQRVHDKMTSSRTQPPDNIRAFRDSRRGPVPEISVVIVTYNRHEQLINGLNALKEQTEKTFEVIVVNNGADVPGTEDLSGCLDEGMCYIQLKDNFGPSMARNIAISYAKGKYVAFLDDDVVAHRDFVRNILEHFKNEGVCGLRGRVLRRTEGFQADPYDLGDEVIPAACDITGNSAYRKDAFVGVGGFDNNLFYYEGTELSFRVYKSMEHKVDCILYCPDVIVFHDHPDDRDNSVLENIRRMTTEKLIAQKDPGFSAYLQFMDGFYSQKRYDAKYRRYIAWFKLYEEKDPNMARQYITKAIDANPFEYLAYFHLASLHMKLNEMGHAGEMFERTIALLDHMIAHDTDKLMALRNRAEINDCYVSSSTKLASVYMSSGEHEKAAAVFEKLLCNEFIKAGPGHEQQIRQWLEKYHSSKKLRGPEALSDAASLNRRGEELFSEGDIEGASEAFRRAIRICPEYVTAYNNLGVLHVHTGDTQTALQYFQRSLSLDPADRDTVLNYGKVLAGLGRPEEAMKLFSSYLVKRSDSEIEGLMAYCGELCRGKGLPNPREEENEEKGSVIH